MSSFGWVWIFFIVLPFLSGFYGIHWFDFVCIFCSSKMSSFWNYSNFWNKNFISSLKKKTWSQILPAPFLMILNSDFELLYESSAEGNWKGQKNNVLMLAFIYILLCVNGTTHTLKKKEKKRKLSRVRESVLLHLAWTVPTDYYYVLLKHVWIETDSNAHSIPTKMVNKFLLTFIVFETNFGHICFDLKISRRIEWSSDMT